jgi:hypothetical protein
MTIKSTNLIKYHESPIQCFALHSERSIILSGDEKGKVFCANYIDGKVYEQLGEHKESSESIVI